MKRLIFISSILLVGCSDPQPKSTFNPNYKHIVMVENQYYRVPAGSTYYNEKYKNTPKDLNEISKLLAYGITCKVGDIIWADSSITNKMKTLDINKRLDFMEQMKGQGRLNCTHSLTEKEYKFYRSKEMEYNANRIARYNAMTSFLIKRTPQNINHNIRYGY